MGRPLQSPIWSIQWRVHPALFWRANPQKSHAALQLSVTETSQTAGTILAAMDIHFPQDNNKSSDECRDVTIVADFRLERKILNRETYEVKPESRRVHCRPICDP